MSYEYDTHLNKHVKAVERAARWMVDNLSELGLIREVLDDVCR